ncbi:hypothetical protein PHYPSEUDO_000553 [Phytophthora pseudosyringae]|uniref:SET domain-containing protein n=1 Tax=Phytophthora pseudosyringae TaxID=221518 RepID=A0A8T1VXQ2_9STRA|nr:hypothetical protein PHYPSEUDO_000553 [Phytophthora pseudosyringae]
MASETTPPSCVGFRCLDRDECYHYDEEMKTASFIHDGATCENTLADVRHRFRYRSLEGDVQMLSADEVQELMKCTYTSKLLFQRTHLLRNYAFWGFSDSVADGFEQFASLDDSTFEEVSPKIAIGHVSRLDHVEEHPLGLFAADDLACYEFLGEYTGVIKIGISEMNKFDPYGISYPSVYEGGDLYVSASEYGNVIRCINHSPTPNARFVPMVHNGILRLFCFMIQETKQGDQIFVNYGPSYWKSTGIEPVAFHEPAAPVRVQ